MFITCGYADASADTGKFCNQEGYLRAGTKQFTLGYAVFNLVGAQTRRACGCPPRGHGLVEGVHGGEGDVPVVSGVGHDLDLEAIV